MGSPPIPVKFRLRKKFVVGKVARALLHLNASRKSCQPTLERAGASIAGSDHRWVAWWSRRPLRLRPHSHVARPVSRPRQRRWPSRWQQNCQGCHQWRVHLVGGRWWVIMTKGRHPVGRITCFGLRSLASGKGEGRSHGHGPRKQHAATDRRKRATGRHSKP